MSERLYAVVELANVPHCGSADEAGELAKRKTQESGRPHASVLVLSSWHISKIVSFPDPPTTLEEQPV